MVYFGWIFRGFRMFQGNFKGFLNSFREKLITHVCISLCEKSPRPPACHQYLRNGITSFQGIGMIASIGPSAMQFRHYFGPLASIEVYLPKSLAEAGFLADLDVPWVRARGQTGQPDFTHSRGETDGPLGIPHLNGGGCYSQVTLAVRGIVWRVRRPPTQDSPPVPEAGKFVSY